MLVLQNAVRGAPIQVGNVGDPVAPQPQLLQPPQRAKAFSGRQAVVSQLQQLQLVQTDQALQLQTKPLLACRFDMCMVLVAVGLVTVRRTSPWSFQIYSTAPVTIQ